MLSYNNVVDQKFIGQSTARVETNNTLVTCNSRYYKYRMSGYHDGDSSCEKGLPTCPSQQHSVETTLRRRKPFVYLLCIVSLIVVFCCVALFLMYMLGTLEEQVQTESLRKLPHKIHVSPTPSTLLSTSPPRPPQGEFLKEYRIAEHCHLPENPTVGMEGFFKQPKYTLEQVHVVISAGETTPERLQTFLPVADCQYSRSHDNETQNFPNTVNSYIQANKLTSEFSHHKISHSEKCPPGQLSPLGVSKLQLIGKYLKHLYSSILNHGAKLSRPEKWIKVYSKNHGSTFHSMVAVLKSFLPESQFHRVHIQKTTDRLCDPFEGHCPCPHLEIPIPLPIDDIIAKMSSFHQNDNESFKRFLSNFRDKNMSAIDALKFLSPIICDRKSELSGCQGNCCWNLTVSHVRNLFSQLDKHITTVMKGLSDTDLTNLYVYPFLSFLIKSFERAPSSKSHKMFLYTADENLMFYILSGIRHKLDKIPRPGSRLVFELLSSSHQEKKRYFLRILYNGRDITSTVPLCYSLDEDNVCRLKYFVDYHSINFRNMFSKPGYSNLCY